MPNKPKTPTHNIRVPDELWDAALACARADGTTLTALINDTLRLYVAEHAKAKKPNKSA